MSTKPKKVSCNAPVSGFSQQQQEVNHNKHIDPRFSNDTKKKDVMKNYEFIVEMR